MCMVGVCYGRARLAADVGAGLGAPRPVPVPDPGLPAPEVFPAGGGSGARACLPGAGPVQEPGGQVISLFTEQPYNHVSLSFDRDLTTLVSYNGGGPGEAPGLNPETVAELVHRRGSSVRLYRLPATRDQKRIILRRLGKIDQEGSAYNLLGLVLPCTGQPNTMFCSQFVYGILKLAGLAYFQKDPLQVRPTDLLEWDLQGRLEFLREYTHTSSVPASLPALGQGA